MTTPPLHAPFHLHALLQREPPNVLPRGGAHTGHDVARDAWRRYTGTALLWYAAPQHDWRGVGDALGHPLHWHAYTCTMPHSGQLDGLLWVADLGSGLRAVVLACAQLGRYGFAVCVLPPASTRHVQEWSWAPAADARAGVGVVDLAHAHAFVRPGNYAAVLAKVILPARLALGLWDSRPYNPRDFASYLRDATERKGGVAAPVRSAHLERRPGGVVHNPVPRQPHSAPLYQGTNVPGAHRGRWPQRCGPRPARRAAGQRAV